MKTKNFKVISKSGSVMIQALDIDGALKIYRLDASLDENILCVWECGQKSVVSVDEIKHTIELLQSKHDAFMGTDGEQSRQSFKNGLSWAIGSFESLIS